MGKEIERKFLVDAAKLRADLLWEPVKQGYLGFEPQVRVRLWRGKGALTIKSAGMKVRNEWEYEIPNSDAEGLLELCKPHILEKERALVMHQGKEWCIDRFLGSNKGLITAEIELESENEKIILPDWVSEEVTDNAKYLNINLVKQPWRSKL